MAKNVKSTTQESVAMPFSEKASAHIADVQKALEAAYQDFWKAQSDSIKQWQTDMQDIYGKYTQRICDIDADANAQVQAMQIEREYVDNQYDVQEQYGKRFEEIMGTYENAIRDAWDKVNIKDLSIQAIAETSRMIWHFSYCP